MSKYIHSLSTGILLSALSLAGISGCSSDDTAETENALLKEVITDYADVVLLNYQDALSKAQNMQTAVNNLVSAPSEANLTAAKDAWLAAREPYGQSEAFRFYGGPIDDEDGPEGEMNSWPLDESYIDYVEVASNGDNPADNDGTNIINSTETFPVIDKALISSLNEQGSETNISAGYHAIEFLLWGQDKSEGPGGGTRPYTDYVTDGTGTADNQERRAQYLQAVTELLVDDLQSLVNEWQEGGAYRSFFTSEEQLTSSLERIFNSLGKLSKGELAGERMFVAYDLRSKEDEHSCFSDNTHRDIVNNALGMQNVYLGRYDTMQGKSIYDLVAFRNQALADELAGMIATSVSSAEAIQAPFDQEFLAEPGRTRILTTINALRAQGDKVAEAAALFGYTVNPEDI